MGRRRFEVIPGGKDKAQDNQLSLFKPEKDDASLEQRLSSKPMPPINTFIDYGINFDELASFQSKPDERTRSDNYFGIQKAWYGLNNMESLNGRFGVPHEMLVRMKPFEIVAMYMGIAQVKMDGAVSGGRNERYNRMLQTPETEFGEVVNEIVNIAHEYHGIKVMRNKKSNQIEAPPLKVRMQTISSDTKKKFMASLRIPYRNPGTPNGYYSYEFVDPHPENKPDYTGIEIYRNRIAKFMRVVYARNSQSKQK